MRYIMWSGGWDSTYLLCKRARESEETIQPIFIASDHANEPSERTARNKLLDMIRAKSDIQAEIRMPLEIREDALPSTPEYEAAYEACREAIEALYGPHNMFCFFGRVSLLFDHPEMGMEAPPPGLWENDLGRFGQFLKEHNMTVDKDGNVSGTDADPNFLTVIGCFRYPILFTNELQMLDDVKAWGYFDDVFQNTWSCYSGMDRQCGVCRSCEVKWLCGDAFAWRFDDKAKMDHEIKQYLQTLDKDGGTKYADYFTHYIMNGNWVTVDNGVSTMSADSSAYKATQEKSERLMVYFSYLEKNWPKGKMLNAPII